MKIVEVTYRYDGRDATLRPRPADADEARERLDAGTRAMATLLEGLQEGSGTVQRIITVDPCDLGLAPGETGVPRQRPYAAVLGCADARVPIELVFNEGPNDLFVVRVAGNGVGSDVLGSLKYAAEHLGESLKLVVLLGHSECGAVSAAVDVFLNPRAYLSLASKHMLRNILDRLLLVVHATARRLATVVGPDVTRRPGYRAALIEAAIASNAALTAYTIQQEIGGGPNGLRAAYGVYLIGERQVWAPRGGSPDAVGLAHPPSDLAAFEDFGDAVVRSRRIVALLEGVAQ